MFSNPAFPPPVIAGRHGMLSTGERDPLVKQSAIWVSTGLQGSRSCPATPSLSNGHIDSGTATPMSKP